MLDIKIAPHPTRREILMVLLDGDCVTEVHTAIVGKRLKVPARVESKEYLRAWLEKEVDAGARRYALYRLSKAAMSVQRLRQILREKCVPDPLCEEIVAHHIRLGSLDDTAYAEQLVRRKKRALCGRQGVKWACLKRGIDPDLAEEVYEASTTEQEEREAILAFAKKRQNRPQTDAERKKLISALLRRGFSYDRIQEALRKKIQHQLGKVR